MGSVATDQAASLAEVIASIGSKSDVSVRPGVIIWDYLTKSWQVEVGGVRQKVIWMTANPPFDGASCWTVYVTPKGGQSVCYVAGIVAATPALGANGQVTVVPAGGTTCTVEVRGVPITVTRLAQYTPAVGDEAALLWGADRVFAVGKIGAAAPIIPDGGGSTAPPPPPPVIRGTAKFNTSDSGTWTAGYNWNGYYGQNCFSGSGYVPSSSGNWFYGGATRALADKTNILAVRFYLGSRRPAGNYNQMATIHLYRHAHDSRGGTEPTRTTGPHHIDIPAGWAGGFVTLPQSFGVALKSGGGISIAGDPYVGFTSGSAQPNSGYLEIDWSM
ncbi:minor tail protein [Arthrobacter phage Edmundo]|nr:minor tail protein [Arthrobacter phage Edmundo]